MDYDCLPQKNRGNSRVSAKLSLQEILDLSAKTISFPDEMGNDYNNHSTTTSCFPLRQMLPNQMLHF